MSEKQNFNLDWYFYKSPLSTSFEEILGTYAPWEPVDIPHDWLIGQVQDLYEPSLGWYKKTFLCSNISDYYISLRFDGVYMNSTIYLNHQKIFEWPYGYSSFDVDLNPYLQEGENTIIVCVRHESPNSRWYSGAGIYRNVWLYKKQFQHFLNDGIYISSQKMEHETWKTTISCCVICNTSYEIKHDLLDSNGEILLTFHDDEFTFKRPILWDLSYPYLYQLRSYLLVNGDVMDVAINKFGFREIELSPNSGFFLNGKHIKLKGVCNHHDLGLLGAAFYTKAAKRQLTILKEMGVNALRTSHNMPAPELLDLADEMGILVVDEAFDMWERSKTTYDYARFFKDHSALDIASWVRRDRNHPCVIMWSIGNEIYDTHVDTHGKEITDYLKKEVQKHDPYHNAYVTIGSNYMAWENAQQCADLVKIAGYNYGEKLYETHHKQHPEWVIYGSETSSIVQSRGIYHFPLQNAILSDDDLQCSSLGNSTTSWGAQNLIDCAIKERDCLFSLGQFLWSGFDYIGEPTPYHTKNSYFGQIDTAGFPKDSYYFYQSMWRSFEDFPMLHILPYWDFNEGQFIDVRVFTNAPYVELFLNKNSLGMQKLDHAYGTHVCGDWKVPYEKGTLTAVGYDKHKHPLLCKEKHSFQDADAIVIKTNQEFILNDGRDLLFVEIYVVDEKQIPVENATNRINVHILKGGRLLGLDNGDSADTDEYQTNQRRLFSGKLLAMIAADKHTDTLEIEVTSLGLKSANLKLPVLKSKQKCDLAGFLSCNAKENESFEIPIRKIELSSQDGFILSKDKPSVCVKVQIYPLNATYQDIEYKITDAIGVEIKTASFQVQDKHNICVTANGDGNFVLRAFSKNGTNHISCISCLNFKVKGLGILTMNAYEFINASHYTSYSGELTSGNERGIATSRDQITTITYEHIDFGSYGSNCITLPIFELEGKPTSIEIYEGKDFFHKSNLLGHFTYHKKPIWNEYQEATFYLNRYLKGLSTLTIKVDHKIHLKGFVFTPIEKAYDKLYALAADSIYGDTFTKSDESVNGIGNNVSFVFHDMNFSNGLKKLTICGHTPLDQNTIHIRFQGDEEFTQLAEFQYSEDFCEQTFDFINLNGIYDVTIVFLPGSNFDFKWLQFMA